MDNVIMTTYFCKKKNPQKDYFVAYNDITYIEPWYYSVKNLQLNGIIFHDGLNDEFIKKYETDKIKFIYANSNSYDISINDLRYYVYFDYIIKNENIKNIFMTDGSDVTVVKNPFNKFKQLCVGSERSKGFKAICLKKKIELFNSNIKNTFNYHKNPTNTVYNAGILGGNRKDVLNFLKNMISIFDKFNSEIKTKNLNMIVFNYVVYKIFNQNVISGSPLHSEFKKYQNNRTDVYFIHK